MSTSGYSFAGMKKIINLGLILTSMLGYLEWGAGYHEFLFQTEYNLLFGAGKTAQSFAHPFVILPLLGQLLLLITLFQKSPNKVMGIIGLLCLSVLLLFICFVGILAKNVSIVMSTMPFIFTAILFIRFNRKKM